MTGLRAPACSLSEVVFDLNVRLRAQPFRLRMLPGLTAHQDIDERIDHKVVEWHAVELGLDVFPYY